MNNPPRKIESVGICKLILQDETGARVTITLPRAVPLQEGGILRSLSLGALSTTEIVNDFKKARLKNQELKSEGQPAVAEVVHGAPKEKLTPFDPAAQAAAAMANSDPPPVFVAEGEERKFCTCSPELRIGTRRCLHCGLLIELPA